MPWTTEFERLALDLKWLGSHSTLVARTQALYAETFGINGIQGAEFLTALLRRFSFITSDEYSAAVYDIASYIAQHFDLKETLLCATTADHSTDSGQRFLYDVRTGLGLEGHLSVHTVNRYDHAQKIKHNFQDVILLDEFVGTGRTLAGRAKTLRSHFKSQGRPIPRIHALVLAGMSVSFRQIHHHFESLVPYFSLKKGIAELAEASQKADEYSLISQLESNLAIAAGSTVLPNLGDGASEALFSRALGNCPNSTFPTFWWPLRVNGSARSPMFTRILG